jgi:anti-anti-sigma regulatory factor
MGQEGSIFIGKYQTTFIFKAVGRLTQKSLENVNAAIAHCSKEKEYSDLLLDISECAYMDSTILGIIARWAIAFSNSHAGTLPFLLGLPGKPLEHTFKRMKLNTLFRVSQETQMTEKRALSQVTLADRLSEKEYAKYLFTAHETLAQLSAENAKEFALVIQCLRAELDTQ